MATEFNLQSLGRGAGMQRNNAARTQPRDIVVRHALRDSSIDDLRLYPDLFWQAQGYAVLARKSQQCHYRRGALTKRANPAKA